MGLVRMAAGAAVLVSLGAGGPAHATDSAPPRVSFTTAAGSVLVHAVHTVTGRASDDDAGVARVRVTYCGGAAESNGGTTCGSGWHGLGVVESYDATVSCTSTTRRSCTWSAPLPSRPDRYLVVATATDRLGRTASAGPIDVVVV